VVGQDSAFDSGDPQSGSNVTFEHTFDGSDTFLYQCEPHDGLGMRGAVVG
ncbi:halocyanin, partial [Halobacteriales archaeon QH_6_64_20]